MNVVTNEGTTLPQTFSVPGIYPSFLGA